MKQSLSTALNDCEVCSKDLVLRQRVRVRGDENVWVGVSIFSSLEEQFRGRQLFVYNDAAFGVDFEAVRRFAKSKRAASRPRGE